MNRKNLYILIGVIAVVLLILAKSQGWLAFAVTEPETKEYECIGGEGKIYSIGKTDFIDYDTLVKDEAWLVEVNPYTGTQCLFGQFDAEDVSDDKKEAEYDFSISFKTSPQICKYDIMRTAENIKEVELKHERTWYPWYVDDLIRKAHDNSVRLGDDYQPILIKDLWGWDERLSLKTWYWYAVSGNWLDLVRNLPPYHVYWYEEVERYDVGNIVFDKLAFSTEVILNTREGDYSGIIGNDPAEEGEEGEIAQKQFWLERPGHPGEKRVRAEFNGILSTGMECARTADFNVRAAKVDGVWRIIDKAKLSSYKDMVDGTMADCIDRVLEKRVGYTVEECKNRFNARANTAIQEREVQYRGVKGDVIGNKVKFVYEELRVSYPLIGLRIKADILGVAVRGGEPEIQEDRIKSECFTSGYEGKITVPIKNTADYPGFFYTSVSCPSPIHVSTQPSMNVLKGATKDFVVILTSDDVIKTTERTCSFRVWDDETGKEDSARIDVCVNAPVEPCTPGDLRCSADKKSIEKCSSAGNWVWYKDCVDGEECVKHIGEFKCMECIEEGETIITGFDCCSGLVKKDNKCVKPTVYCESCFSWLWNKIKPGYCTSAKYVDVWYLPESIEEPFTQDSLCPLVLIVYGILFLVVFAIMLLLLLIFIKIVKEARG